MFGKRDALLYNAEGYIDPTAGAALHSVMRESSRRYVTRPGQPIYITVPDIPSTRADLEFLERCCRFAAKLGAQPICPFLFYGNIIDLSDIQQVNILRKWTRTWLQKSSAIWIFGEIIPPFILRDFHRAVEQGKTARFFACDGSGFRQTAAFNDNL